MFIFVSERLLWLKMMNRMQTLGATVSSHSAKSPWDFLRFVYLKNRVTERQREKEISSVHWATPQVAPTSRSQPVWSQGCFWVSYRSQGPKPLGIFHCLLGCIIRELDGKWSNQNLNQHPYGLLAMHGYTMVPALRIFFFFGKYNAVKSKQRSE